jgi:hypothetical protein
VRAWQGCSRRFQRGVAHLLQAPGCRGRCAQPLASRSVSVLWGGKARGKWRPEPIRPLRLGEWLPQPPAERHDRDGTSTHNPQCSPRYCCRLTFLWLAIPLLRASRKDIAHDEWSHRLASATTGASGDIVLTQGALFAPVAACGVNQRVERVLDGRAERSFVPSGRCSGALRPPRSLALSRSI